jgi:hypothetical protein
MESALATDRTLVRKGRSSPKRSTVFAPRCAAGSAAMVSLSPTPVADTTEGPEGWVPIHSSAYGLEGSESTPVLSSPSADTSHPPLMPQS